MYYGILSRCNQYKLIEGILTGSYLEFHVSCDLLGSELLSSECLIFLNCWMLINYLPSKGVISHRWVHVWLQTFNRSRKGQTGVWIVRIKWCKTLMTQFSQRCVLVLEATILHWIIAMKSSKLINQSCITVWLVWLYYYLTIWLSDCMI